METTGTTKTVLHPGSKPIPSKPNTKVHFHFQTSVVSNGKIIDDSKLIGTGKPMELIFGKKFKLQIWEDVLKTMSSNEVAQFEVDKSHCGDYLIVSKTLRDVAARPQNQTSTHCGCSGSLLIGGLGYEDLNLLANQPQDLQFMFEVVKVEEDGDYEKESWQLDDQSKLNALDSLRQDGNMLYSAGQFVKASEKYCLALTYINQVSLRKKPHSEEWLSLTSRKVPFLLNLAQCKIMDAEYYLGIKYCSDVLEIQPDNVKALFRRGKAHFHAWNVEECKKDLKRVLQLDPSLSKGVEQILTQLYEGIKNQKQRELDKLKGKVFPIPN